MAGCGNHGCFIEKPKGQGTNGGCNCLRPLGKENEQVVKRKLTQLAFYKRRVEELERNKNVFPEPYLTMVCNILANGKIEP
ncbi:MAG: hypothetical protein WC153_06685 [Candidatus Methanomethylophilaceae archaeon]|jgi:hypothetical protein